MPTLTPISALPWVPGASPVVGAAAARLAGDAREHASPVPASRCSAGSVLGAVAQARDPVRRRASAGSAARRAGSRSRRRPGRSPCRRRSSCSPAWPARRAPSARSAAILAIPSTRRSSASSRSRCARGHFAGHAQPLRRAWRGPAPACAVGRPAARLRAPTCSAAFVSATNSGLDDLRVRFLRDLADFVVVGLQRLLLFAFQAAVDHQHDHDQQHDRRRPPPSGGGPSACAGRGPTRRRAADGAAAAAAARPAPGGRSATGRCRGVRDDGRGAVSSSSSKNDKSQPLLCRDFGKGPV